MVALDKTIELQRQGLSEIEIAKQLRNEGFSPQEINNALNQINIKNAVSDEETASAEQNNMQNSITQEPEEQSNFQGSISDQRQSPYELRQPPEHSPEVYPNPQGQYEEQYYPQTPQAYSGQEYYPNSGSADSETISEIAEQVVSEKFAEFRKKTGDLITFKNATQDKLVDLDARLRRIEESIAKLQQAIIGKIGEFGENTAMIHRDLDNLHGTVAKLMNPLVDNYNELKKIAGK